MENPSVTYGDSSPRGSPGYARMTPRSGLPLEEVPVGRRGFLVLFTAPFFLS